MNLNLHEIALRRNLQLLNLCYCRGVDLVKFHNTMSRIFLHTKLLLIRYTARAKTHSRRESHFLR